MKLGTVSAWREDTEPPTDRAGIGKSARTLRDAQAPTTPTSAGVGGAKATKPTHGKGNGRKEEN